MTEADPATIRHLARQIAARDGTVTCLSVYRLASCRTDEAYRAMCDDPLLVKVPHARGMVTVFRLKETGDE